MIRTSSMLLNNIRKKETYRFIKLVTGFNEKRDEYYIKNFKSYDTDDDGNLDRVEFNNWVSFHLNNI